MTRDPVESSVRLLSLARNGDDAALNRLLARHIPPLVRWARGRLPANARSLADTADLVQDAVMNAVRHVSRFEVRHDGAFQGYLRQAVINRIRDEYRRSQRQPTASLPPGMAVSEPSPLELAIGREALDRYEAALARLGPAERQAIVARLELGCTYAEIAAALGKPSAAAARMVVNRAVVRLAGLMRT